MTELSVNTLLRLGNTAWNLVKTTEKAVAKIAYETGRLMAEGEDLETEMHLLGVEVASLMVERGVRELTNFVCIKIGWS